MTDKCKVCKEGLSDFINLHGEKMARFHLDGTPACTIEPKPEKATVLTDKEIEDWDYGRCQAQEDGTHCNCWWDGGDSPCCSCGTPGADVMLEKAFATIQHHKEQAEKAEANEAVLRKFLHSKLKMCPSFYDTDGISCGGNGLPREGWCDTCLIQSLIGPEAHKLLASPSPGTDLLERLRVAEEKASVVAELEALGPDDGIHDPGDFVRVILEKARKWDEVGEWIGQYRLNYEAIGKILEPIREKRRTGEPAQSDVREIQILANRASAAERRCKTKDVEIDRLKGLLRDAEQKKGGK